jgi:hypothetical protein
VGLKTLEGRTGRRMLQQLGLEVLEQWRISRQFNCSADGRRMAQYVDHFLGRLRDGFPITTIDSTILDPDCLAATTRMDPVDPADYVGDDVGPSVVWDGNRDDYLPVGAVALSVNYEVS